MKLLLVAVAVCAVCPRSVLTKPSKQARDLHAYPYEVSGPDGSELLIQHLLYSYSINNSPFETNIRKYGQNPAIPESVNMINQGMAVPRTAIPEVSLSPFYKGSVQAFPSAPQQVFTYDAKTYEEDQFDDGDIPLRSAVESIPIEAEVYSHLRNPDVYSDDSLQFNREGVESLPFFPTPYTAPPQGFTYNAKNEHPLRQLSEQHSEGHSPFDDNKIDLVTPYHYPVNTRSTDKKLVCYFESWSVSHPKPFAVTDIDPFSCTHIIYAFAGLDNTTWSIKSLDPELDIDQGAYKAAIGLKAKNPNLKVMIGIGGWAEGGKNYSEMVSKKERRDAFVTSVISFMEEHQWDGLDLDWEYPGSSDRGGRSSDKANFAALVSELSAEFKTRGWLLTAAVTPARVRVDDGYDVAKLAQDLDYIFVMTYDLRGIWYGKADHHAPLSSREIDEGDLKYLNAKDSLNYWNSKGAPMHKLLMGIPFYARTFRLTSKSNTKPGAQAKSGGYMDYYQICQEQRNGSWKMERDSVGGPYMVKGDLWVGYDDTEYIATKMEVVNSMGLGGAFVWAINQDDSLGVCGTKWPLLSTMRKGLYGSDGMAPVTQAPAKAAPVTQAPAKAAPVTQAPAKAASVTQAPTRPSAVITEASNKTLVCYYGGWSVNRPKPFNLAVADIDPFACTHIIYSFAGLDNTTWSIKSLVPERDIAQEEYKAAIGLKAKNPNLKVMVAIGGWNEGGKSYSEMASKKERRNTFVASVISFMEEHQWDGLDLDWEYPGASDRGGRPSDKANFAALVSELSVEFKTRGWLLTAAVPPKRSAVDEGYDVAKIARDLDYIFVMTYDLRSIRYGKADHHSPLSSRDIDAGDLKYHNTKDGLNYWNSKGAPMHKLLMGIPFYGRTFTLTSKSETKPGAQAKSSGLRDFLPYYEICQEQRNGSWEMARDSVGGPYMVKEDQWVGYDDTEYIATKMEAVHSMGLGGAFTWAIDLDDFLGVCGTKWPLINTMREGLYGSDGKSPVTQDLTTQAPVVTEATSCVSQNDCPSTHACVGWTCMDPCVARCGPNAKCRIYNHLGYCSCPINYTGNPYLYCSEIDSTVSIDDKIIENTTTTTMELQDDQTETSTEESQSCVNQSDCPSNRTCVGGTCMDPCVARCGPNAKCQVYNRQPYCSCLTNYTGNPYLYCSEIDATVSMDKIIENTTTTTTELQDDQTETSTEESERCVNQSDCPSNRACVGGTCMDPCVARCGPNAKCQVYNRQPYCSCLTNYTGNPYLYCSETDAAATVSIDDKIEKTNTATTELPDNQTKTSTEESQSCVNQSDCPSTHACVGGTCMDPCVARCGPNAKCRVYNRQPYCSCSTNYTGNPYLYCSEIAEKPTPIARSSEVTTALATSQPIATTPAAEFICSGSGYLRDESECSVYYLCNPELIAYKFACPIGLYFDLNKSTCDWPHNVKCEKGHSSLN